MSKVKIQGNASGTGVLTISAPNTSTDRTITLPDTTGTLLDENSSVPAANLTGTVADARISALTASKLTGALPAISGASLTGLTSAQMPTGSVLQVVQATGNSQTQVNTSWTDIAGASVTITPSATSSKVFITFSTGGMTNGTADNISLKLLRGSTDIRVQSRYGYDTVSGWSPVPLHMIYLDGPGSTSAVTYKMQTKTDVDNDLRINSDQENNGGGNGVVMIAMEIAG
jgi:hypothetical protein